MRISGDCQCCRLFKSPLTVVCQWWHWVLSPQTWLCRSLPQLLFQTSIQSDIRWKRKEFKNFFQVCEHICNCLGTAARFEACRQRLAEMPTIFGNLCRLLQFPVCLSEHYSPYRERQRQKKREEEKEKEWERFINRFFKQLASLGSSAAGCICSLAVDTLLQTQLFQVESKNFGEFVEKWVLDTTDR